MKPITVAIDYLHRGWAVVAVEHMGKKPIEGRNWQKKRHNLETVEGSFPEGQPRNIGVLTGPASNGLIDIDLDCKEAIDVAPLFLKETATFGRLSKPISHYLYYSEDVTPAKYRDPAKVGMGSVLLEVRSTGQQTVFPGSTHSSGERVEWARHRDPHFVRREDIERAASQVAAAALLRRYWPAVGSREEAASALSAWLGAGSEPLVRALHGRDVERALERSGGARGDERAEAYVRLARLFDTRILSAVAQWLGLGVQAPRAEGRRGEIGVEYTFPRGKDGGAGSGAGGHAGDGAGSDGALDEAHGVTASLEERRGRATRWLARVTEYRVTGDGSNQLIEICGQLVRGFALGEAEALNILRLSRWIAEHPTRWKETDLHRRIRDAYAGPVVWGSKLVARVVDIRGNDGGDVNHKDSDGSRGGVDWTSELLFGAEGELRRCVANVATILRADPAWVGVLAYNELAGAPCVTREPPARRGEGRAAGEGRPWLDVDTVRTSAWLSEAHDLDVSHENIIQAVNMVSRLNAFHPIRDYLKGLKWDGVNRAGELFTRYFGAMDSSYVRSVGRCFLIGLVARVMEPGCKMDTMVVLEGNQGIGKSTALRTLIGDAWFSNTPPKIGDRDAFISLLGKWLIEWGELVSLLRVGSEQSKCFLSSAVDHYRGVWAKIPESVPRQCVFVGTTNAEQYLMDETGNRRFWPVKCGRFIDIDALRRDRDMLFAETMGLYNGGHKWYFDDTEIIRQAAVETDLRFAGDVWEERVATWLAVRRNVSTSEILKDCLLIEPGRWSRRDEMRVAVVLKGLGYERRRVYHGNSSSWRYFKE